MFKALEEQEGPVVPPWNSPKYIQVLPFGLVGTFLQLIGNDWRLRSVFLLGMHILLLWLGFLESCLLFLLLSPTMDMEKNPWEILIEKEEMGKEEPPSH